MCPVPLLATELNSSSTTGMVEITNAGLCRAGWPQARLWSTLRPRSRFRGLGRFPASAIIGERPVLKMAKALIFVDDQYEPTDVMQEVGRKVHIRQRLPPRLAIVDGEPMELRSLKDVPGVRAVCTGAIESWLLEGLNAVEQTFAEAWQLALQPKASRIGDGLSWDAEGFQPPDRPDHSSGET